MNSDIYNPFYLHNELYSPNAEYSRRRPKQQITEQPTNSFSAYALLSQCRSDTLLLILIFLVVSVMQLIWNMKISQKIQMLSYR